MAENTKDNSLELTLQKQQPENKTEGKKKAPSKTEDKKAAVKLNRKTTAANAAAKKSKGNLFKRFTKYVKGVVNELKKVHWPTRREVVIYTIVVVIAVLFMAVLLYAFDLFFGYIMSLIGL